MLSTEVWAVVEQVFFGSDWGVVIGPAFSVAVLTSKARVVVLHATRIEMRRVLSLSYMATVFGSCPDVSSSTG